MCASGPPGTRPFSAPRTSGNNARGPCPIEHHHKSGNISRITARAVQSKAAALALRAGSFRSVVLVLHFATLHSVQRLPLPALLGKATPWLVSGLDAPRDSLPTFRLRGFPPSLPSPLGSRHPFRLQSAPPTLRQRPTLRRPDPHARTALTILPQYHRPCQRRKHRHLSAPPSSRPPPAAPIGLPAHYFSRPAASAFAEATARLK